MHRDIFVLIKYESNKGMNVQGLLTILIYNIDLNIIYLEQNIIIIRLNFRNKQKLAAMLEEKLLQLNQWSGVHQVMSQAQMYKIQRDQTWEKLENVHKANHGIRKISKFVYGSLKETKYINSAKLSPYVRFIKIVWSGFFRCLAF